MFRLFLCSTASTTQRLKDEWQVHYGAHCYWRNKVYSDFHVENIPQVLNLEPAIDHVDHYNVSIPEYFKSALTIIWIDQNYDHLPPQTQADARAVVRESASIFAADAMCHPRDRVGKFDWSDVMKLHAILSTPYQKLLAKLFNLRKRIGYVDF